MLNRYYYLSPSNNQEFKIIPLVDKDIMGVIKIRYLGTEQLALIRKDNPSLDDIMKPRYLFNSPKVDDFMNDWRDSIYLFKD